MSACAFFGHADAPERVRPLLREQIEVLIVREGVRRFYVGNHGAFDRMAYAELCEMRKKHPHIQIRVILAYMPTADDDRYREDGVLPDGIEGVPYRFAIDYRNKWMLRQVEWVVAYVCRPFGGAAKYVALARAKEIKVINLG